MYLYIPSLSKHSSLLASGFAPGSHAVADDLHLVEEVRLRLSFVAQGTREQIFKSANFY